MAYSAAQSVPEKDTSCSAEVSQTRYFVLNSIIAEVDLLQEVHTLRPCRSRQPQMVAQTLTARWLRSREVVAVPVNWLFCRRRAMPTSALQRTSGTSQALSMPSPASMTTGSCRGQGLDAA